MDNLILTGRHDALVIPVAFDWPSPDRVVEAIGDSTRKRAQRANRAGQDVIADRNSLERGTVQQIHARLQVLKDALQRRLLATSVTDFRAFTLRTLLADVDRLIKHAEDDMATAAERDFTKAADLGVHAVDVPLEAAQLHVPRPLLGVRTAHLVQAAFGNTVDLLSPPMVQYATRVKQAVRAVSLAGDNRFDAIQKLARTIGGDDHAVAQFKAERIIRTEVGRVFNTATFDRLKELSGDFPFITKGWRATADARTRHGHVEAGQTYARGRGIAVGDPFRVNVYDERPAKKKGERIIHKLIGVARLQYPIDPDAAPSGRIAAGATIMCRCNAFVDFIMGDFASFAADKISVALGRR